MIYNAPSVIELRSHCPGSGLLSSKMPRTEQSAKAAKGDIVHDAIMLKLSKGMEPKHLEEEYDRNTVNIAVDLIDKRLKEMTGKGVAHYRKLKAIKCEKSLALGHVGWPGRAKADVVIYLDSGTVMVLEIKTGEWEVTGPSANRQVHDYLCGTSRIMPDLSLFYAVILQPALIEELQWREAKYTRLEVDALGEQLKAFRRATFEPDAPLIWGEHCSKCSAAQMCPARRGTLELAAKTLQECGPDVASYMEKLKPAERTARLEEVRESERFAKKFYELVKAWKLNTPGAELPGYKIGTGKGQRSFVGAAPDASKRLWEAFGDTFKAKGIGSSPEALLEVKSPATLEKALSKAEKEKLGTMDIVMKEAGALTVVEDVPTKMPKPRED